MVLAVLLAVASKEVPQAHGSGGKTWTICRRARDEARRSIPSRGGDPGIAQEWTPPYHQYEKSWIFTISQWFLGNLGGYLIHPPSCVLAEAK